ncbi:MAG: LmeA family phospholipid-binding protein [Acidimicrobiales bacterium]
MRRGPARLVLALMIVGLLVSSDLVARTVAERRLAARVATAVPAADATSAHIHSFPFLARLLSSGHVSNVDVRVRGVEVRGLRFDSITVDLEGVQIDRTELVGNGRVVVEKVTRGTVHAIVTEAAISQLTGVPVHLEAGRASVTVFGREVGVDLAVRDARLVIGAAAGISLPGFDLVAPLLPCIPDAEILAGRVVLSCEFTDVPVELRV